MLEERWPNCTANVGNLLRGSCCCLFHRFCLLFLFLRFSSFVHIYIFLYPGYGNGKVLYCMVSYFLLIQLGVRYNTGAITREGHFLVESK